MVVNNNNFNRINSIPITHGKPVEVQQPRVQKDFGSILQETIDKAKGIKFSKHAELRLQARNINLTEAQMKRLDDAVSKAEKKGVKDSLVLVDEVALVVNVRSRTVITAISSDELKENVFTNIDGAIIV